MPFVEDMGPIGSGLGPAQLIVDRDGLFHLELRLREIRKEIEEFIYKRGDSLLTVLAPGADPCSEATVDELSHNGRTAVEVTKAFVAQLDQVITALGETARTYQLAEESNTGKFEREPG
jgi:hypothetical protein